MRRVLIALLMLLPVSCFAEVPSVDADLGQCSARFKVSDAAGAPVYNATVHLKIERKLLALPNFFTIRGIGSRDKEVQVLTDSNGEVVILGLPGVPKKPLVFDISKSRFMSLVVFAPDNNCHPTFSVRLE